jgi:hypothetical protein
LAPGVSSRRSFPMSRIAIALKAVDVLVVALIFTALT